MKTTITLDPDVEKVLLEQAGCTPSTIAKEVNEALRRLYIVPRKEMPKTQSRELAFEPLHLGVGSGINETKLNQLNDEMEIEGLLKKVKQK